MQIGLKRAYEKPEPSDGTRVLVDRLWPRGVKKEEARIDSWPKEIAPSNELRKWFGHDPGRWNEFEKHYTEELRKKEEVVKELGKIIEKGKTTLVFGAKDEEHNNAVVLKQFLMQKGAK